MDSNHLDPRYRVLVVDDEKVVSLTLVSIFMQEGYDARGVGSAEEGLELIETWIPNLALVDVCLPEMNGIDFAFRLIAKCADCHFLLFSGQPESADLLEYNATDGHCLEIIAKPVHPTTLLERAAQMLLPNGVMSHRHRAMVR